MEKWRVNKSDMWRKLFPTLYIRGIVAYISHHWYFIAFFTETISMHIIALPLNDQKYQKLQ